MTNKQVQEIDFLCRYFGGQTSPEIEKEYLLATTQGVRTVADKFSKNPLRIAKTKLDRNVKFWREGLEEGTFFPWELEEDFASHPFGAKVIRSTVSSTHKWRDYYKDQTKALLAFAIRENHAEYNYPVAQ
jgi:hypothetical protein